MEKVFQYIEENQEMYVEWLQKLCQQPSVSTQNRGMEETVRLVKEFLEITNSNIEIIETKGYPVVYGELKKPNSKTLSFYNHYDVQPEDPIDQWDDDPFSAVIKDGKMIARGVADNKGSLLSRICAVHAYQQVKGELPGNIKFIFEGEEEIGSPNIEEFKEKYPEKIKTDGFIWEGGGVREDDGTMQVALGVKGTCYVELKAKGAKTDIHSSEAAIVENPVWRLIWALNTIKNEQEEILIDGFYDQVKKPSETDLKLIEEMQLDENGKLAGLGLDSFLLNLEGTDLKEKYYFKPTGTICGIQAGYTGEGTKTVLPSEAFAKIDFRLVHNQEPNEITRLLRKHLDKHGFEDIEVELLTGIQPFKTDPDTELAQIVMNNIEEIYGKPPKVLPVLAGSSSIYKLCKDDNIPAILVGVGNVNSNFHGPNENIYIRDYIDGIKLTASVINDFLNT
ncbi:M20/M25/M40 family metallo-hydrolase [Virgibacillus dakarensis]|uniref:M20/M25/M40 family metallo-hydrolase n=1 Tax=Virgibacillus dakarensis TaxID=1917889 RepID=UPI000B4330C3|nr:M20/M25/M40 family metallo-hydrolase [Virgibacillus dakarensis]